MSEEKRGVFDPYIDTESTEVLILGGGQGSRLYPLTKERAKPAVPVGGKFRLIDLPLSNCLHSNLPRIYILTQFNSDSLHRHIAQTYRFDSFSRGFIQILAAQQTPDNKDWFQGTADAVRHALRRFVNRRPKYIMILSGDHLYRMDYRKLLKTHVENEADVTISVLPIARDRASDFGILQVNEEGRITAFQEKPTSREELDQLIVPSKLFEKYSLESKGRQHIASMGIYVFNLQSLSESLIEHSGSPDFGKHIIPALIGSKRVFAHFFDGYWEDIGTIRSFYEANLALTRPVPEFNFYDERHLVYSRPRFLPGTKVNQATIRASIIGDGAIVSGAVIEDCIIGLRGVIAENAQLYRTIMMGADYYDSYEQRQEDIPKNAPPLGIGSRSIVKNAIVDKNARIGADVRILNEAHVQEADGPNYYIRDGIVVIPRSAIIPSGTVI
ncbi:MAG: glucose-1-phosphate adenylyltransferase [Candidatus Omnitrophica bacterium]|nr:glucose-1-phosphate adenylyltransferase [Candidatus Omnitrophota bacterium]